MTNDNQRTTIVVVGHVDHGKSTLLGRLLLETGNLPKEKIDEIEKASSDQGRRFEYAFLTDQFQEERSANVTIDTSQIFLNLNDRPFLLVDAPGHKEFLKNMISGTSYARNALLMLDVKEGIQEQTERHAQILQFMGIAQIAVVINKMDLVDYKQDVFDAKKSEVQNVLATYQIIPQFVIPASSYYGENITKPSEKMKWHTGPTVLDFFLACKADSPYSSEGSFCFPVQLGIDFEGQAVALGRIEQGSARSGDRVRIFPEEKLGTIEKILRYPTSPSQADAGSSVALKLSGIDSFSRGQVILSANMPVSNSKRILCQLLWASEVPLKVGDPVLVECRSQKAMGTVVAMSNDSNDTMKQLENGDIASAQFTFQDKIFLSLPDGIPPLSKIVVHHNKALSGCAIVSKIFAALLVFISCSEISYAYIDPGTGVTFATGLLGWIVGLLTLVAGGALLLIKRSWHSLKEKAQKVMKACGF